MVEHDDQQDQFLVDACLCKDIEIVTTLQILEHATLLGQTGELSVKTVLFASLTLSKQGPATEGVLMLEGNLECTLPPFTT